MGLFLNTSEAFDGYTLFSNNETTYLIDNCGRKVREWESSYKAGQGVYLLPQGDLLRAGTLPGDFPEGGRGGIFELFDWDGHLKWQYKIADNGQQAHHDIAPMPNGNFLCTVWKKKGEEESKTKGRKFDGEVWSEHVLELEILPNDQAKIVWEWSVWDHLVQDHDPARPNFGVIADHPELIDINFIGLKEETHGDWLHINSVSYNPVLDQIVLSSRHLSEIYVIDHSTTSSEAASHQGGKCGKGGAILYRFGNPQVYGHGTASDRILGKQHHIDWVPGHTKWAGEFVVFNNEFIPGQQSNVIIFNNPVDEHGCYHFDPENGFGTEKILRSYTSPSFYSDILSGVQVLPNNNLLILEGRPGRIFEVNEGDQVVWEYINPVNVNGGPGIQGGTPRFNSLFRAIRYTSDYLGLNDKDLAGTLLPVELSPIESDCTTFQNVVSSSSASNQEDLPLLMSNPVVDYLYLRSNQKPGTEAWILSITGRQRQKVTLYPGLNAISLNGFPAGVYIFLSKGNCQRFVKL